jgi:hypothetical protein
VGSNIYQVFSSSCGCYTGLNIIFTESGGLSLSTGTEVSGLLASVGADLSEAILADNVNTIASALETSTADDAGSSGGSSLVNAYPLYETVADEIAVNESAIDTVAQEIVFPTPTPDETTVVAEETPATTTNTNTPEVTEEAPKTDTSGD